MPSNYRTQAQRLADLREREELERQERLEREELQRAVYAIREVASATTLAEHMQVRDTLTAGGEGGRRGAAAERQGWVTRDDFQFFRLTEAGELALKRHR